MCLHTSCIYAQVFSVSAMVLSCGKIESLQFLFISRVTVIKKSYNLHNCSFKIYSNLVYDKDLETHLMYFKI